MTSVYCRYPHIHEEQIVFVARDQLWIFDGTSASPRALAHGSGTKSHPYFSPDGRTLAYTAMVGTAAEVFELELTQPVSQPMSKQKTFFNESARVAGWLGNKILFTSAARRPFVTQSFLYAGDHAFGSGVSLTESPEHGRVLCRYEYLEPALWKRYRGGARGTFWIDADASGNFKPFPLTLDAHLSRPCWVGARLYFLSDHEGVGHVYSCDPEGRDLKRHSEDSAFYARQLSTDGKSLVYARAGELFRLKPGETPQNISIQLPPVTETVRSASVMLSLQDFSLDPTGTRCALLARGHLLISNDLNQKPESIDSVDSATLRLPRWLDAEKILSFREDLRRSLAVVHADGKENEIDLGDTGRVLACEVRPGGQGLALANHRNELVYFDLINKKVRVIERGRFELIDDAVWSPDGESVAYSVLIAPEVGILKIWNIRTGESRAVTEPHLRDRSPSFSTDGKSLYFISQRKLKPTAGQAGSATNFTASWQPCVLDLASGLTDVLPVPEGEYQALWASGNSVIYLDQRPAGADVGVYRWDFETKREDKILDSVFTAQVCADGSRLAALTKEGLHVIKLKDGTSTVMNLEKLEVQYDERAEWRSLLTTTWTLQRDFFYDETMNGIDWAAKWKMYEPLLERIGSRAECSDLIWELNGELGTSHAYAFFSAGTPLADAPKSQRPERYLEWQKSKHTFTKEKGRGRIGYIHVPNTYADGFTEFHRQFLQSSDTEALILDLRYNSGGNLGEFILDRLNRKDLGRTLSRGFATTSFPPHARKGPLLVLINGFAGSDGEQLAELLRLSRGAILIGEPTWGGVTGSKGRTQLVGGGALTQPRTVFEIENGPRIENHGVQPDISIAIAPQEEARGIDPQLARAVEEALRLIK